MNTIPVDEGASALTLCDRQWLLDLRNHLRSHAEFFEATRREAHDLNERAADLIVWHDGRFQTVRELVDECANHNWNAMIYEAWVWETSNRIHRLIGTLGSENDIAARAIELRARRMDYFDADYCEAMDAMAEARRWLYDEP